MKNKEKVHTINEKRGKGFRGRREYRDLNDARVAKLRRVAGRTLRDSGGFYENHASRRYVQSMNGETARDKVENPSNYIRRTGDSPVDDRYHIVVRRDRPERGEKVTVTSTYKKPGYGSLTTFEVFDSATGDLLREKVYRSKGAGLTPLIGEIAAGPLQAQTEQVRASRRHAA